MPLTVTIEKNCPCCNKYGCITVTTRQLEAWKAGTKIQDVFPELTATEREFLQTGICDQCWDDMWKEKTV